MEESCCTGKTKERSEEEYRSLTNRLSRIEGQIRGIKGMLEKDAYCVDVILQVSAVNAALSAFSRELLGEHIKSCVVNDIKEDKLDTVDELVGTVLSLVK